MKMKYIAPSLKTELIVADTSISSCVLGDCGYTGDQIVACAEDQSMTPGSYRQDDPNHYTYCVDFEFMCE